jgi:hypothetical protein
MAIQHTAASTGSETFNNPSVVGVAGEGPDWPNTHQHEHRQGYRSDRAERFPQKDLQLEPGESPEAMQHDGA